MENKNEQLSGAFERLFEKCVEGFETAFKYGWWLGLVWGIGGSIMAYNTYYFLMYIWNR